MHYIYPLKRLFYVAFILKYCYLCILKSCKFEERKNIKREKRSSYRKRGGERGKNVQKKASLNADFNARTTLSKKGGFLWQGGLGLNNTTS